jgi:predicted phosphodiesterase
MDIGVLSDTHDRLPTMQAALEEFRQRGITTILHPGDIVAPFAAKVLAAWAGTLYVTYGNNDGERRGLKQVLPQIQDGPLHLAGRPPRPAARARMVPPRGRRRSRHHRHRPYARASISGRGRLFVNRSAGWVSVATAVWSWTRARPS